MEPEVNPSNLPEPDSISDPCNQSGDQAGEELPATKPSDISEPDDQLGHSSDTLAEEPAVRGSNLPETESVCGEDERLEIDPMTSPPYNWICYLSIKAANGRCFRGTGFKIHFPDLNVGVVVTSAHCVYIKKAYASQITLTFPGKDPIVVQADSLYASPEYIRNESEDHDYGLIVLPYQERNDGFGWSTQLKDQDLKNRLVTVCGYPGDKPSKTMWITGGEIEVVTSDRLYYMNDTYGGQSGSPIYTWYNGFWTVVGVHSYGGCPNSAPRFTVEMISRFAQKVTSKKVIQSAASQNVFLRMDCRDLTSFRSSGGGKVNCQWAPVGTFEQFYVYPVEMPPSPVKPDMPKVAIESAYWENVFLRMNGTRIHAFDRFGGGQVNGQYGALRFEIYYLKHEERGSYEDELYSIISVAFPHCRLRMNGKDVDEAERSTGGGQVNCQYYGSINDEAKEFEKFSILKLRSPHV